MRATYVRKPNTTQVYVAGIGMAEPRPVTLFRDAEYHCAREGIVLVDPPVDARDPIGDGQGDVRWVMRMDDASLMGIPRPATAVDVDALAESLAPLLDDVDGAPSAAEVAAAVSVALAPEFDAIPMEVVDEAAARLAGLD